MVTTVRGEVEGVVGDALCRWAGDPAAQVTWLDVRPIDAEGYSGHELLRVEFGWRSGAERGLSTWVVKTWRPGGHSERLYGVDRPVEALAWRDGVPRPRALPPGVTTPIVAADVDPMGAAAWVVMDDVAPALARYSRVTPLPAHVAVVRLATVMRRLAALHAWWQAPARLSWVRTRPWLVPLERRLWSEAGSYAEALGRPRPPLSSPGTPVSDEFRANVAAVVDWLPATVRSAVADVLCDRSALVRAVAALPPTLCHGDLDDRNIGLAPRERAHGDAVDGEDDLVLIDWEWTGLGPPLLDVARVWATFAAVCDRDQPPPAEVFTHDLPRQYLAEYHRLGGIPIDDGEWQRLFGLALLANGVSQVDFFGAMVRQKVGPVLRTLEPQIALMADAAKALRRGA